jgi:phosphoesterase RecJ-like protein
MRLTEQETARWLLERDRFLILTHARPDGDTLGCGTALTLALQQLGKTAWMAPNPEVAPKYGAFLDFPWAPEGYAPAFIVNVDIADEQLLPDTLQGYRGKCDLCIDHHGSNQDYAKNLCLDAGASACAEPIFRICKTMGAMAEPVARALYLALSTDNGCFAYSNTTPESHRVAAELLEWGDFMHDINKCFFQTKRRKELELQNYVLSNLDFYEEDQVAIGGLTLAEGSDREECSELSSFMASIEGVKCAALWRERKPGEFKLSVRTDERWINASEICAHFNGGGHAAAAGGCMEHTTLAEAKAAVRDCILQMLHG